MAKKLVIIATIHDHRYMKKAFIQSIIALFLGTSSSLLAQETPLEVIKIGVTAGPHVEIMEFVKDQSLKDGIDLKIIEFNDYILPNIALDDGDIDLNSYQHLPFLEDQVANRGYKLSSIGKSILLPISIYSKKLQSIDQLKDKAQIAIPNDPTNGARALLLLQSLRLIELKSSCGTIPSILDIKQNPKKLKILELEAPQVPRALDDVDAAIINTDWAFLAKIDPKLAIASESANSPYANVIVSRTKDKDNSLYQKFVKIYQSNSTKEFIQKTFGKNIIPAWESN